MSKEYDTVNCAVSRSKMLAPEEGTGASTPAVRWRVGSKLAATKGKNLPSCAYMFSFAARSVASAACKLGLFCSDCSIRVLSAGDLKSDHHCCGISRPSKKIWRRPEAASAEPVCVAHGSRRHVRN